jgi:hypothetical protein
MDNRDEQQEQARQGQQSQRFHFEINSFEEFVAFVALIRNEDFSKLPELAAKLKKSTAALSTALVQGEQS